MLPLQSEERPQCGNSGGTTEQSFALNLIGSGRFFDGEAGYKEKEKEQKDAE